MTAERLNPDAASRTELEQLSCFVDGELDDLQCDRWFARLSQDRAVHHEWTLLHLAGDALRSSEVACWHSRDFSARVASAIAAEPVIVAPALAARRRRLLQRVVLPGAAVAAATAVLAVMVVPMLRDQGASGPVQASAPAPVRGAAMATTASGQVVERSPHMEAYLAAHREVSGAGMMPPATPLLRASTALADEGR